MQVNYLYIKTLLSIINSKPLNSVDNVADCLRLLQLSAFLFQCPSGYYADSTGSAICTICPAGSECSDPAVSPVACSSGQVSHKLCTRSVHKMW